jgi:predicted AAA+ superfamily ATPase
MLIKRYLLTQVRETLTDGNVAIVYGARQTGKTTLVRALLDTNKQGLYLNCDEPDIRERLTNKTSTEIKALFGNAQIVAIDEAQRIPNIGVTAKLVHDTYPDIQLLLTGSSSIDLANTIKEPLTGRAHEHILYPLALTEVATNALEAGRLLEKSLVLGGYPGMWQLGHDKAVEYLRDLANNYLYRDAFAANVVYDTTLINKLLQLLAYQVGDEVSYNEIATRLEVSKETIMRYIDLLEKAFIIFRVNQYRKNQRSEVGRLRKVYFYDLGVRNGLIDNFLPLSRRDDVGKLWENFCMVERQKYLQRNHIWARSYFWRSYTRQEVDLVEEIGTTSAAYEFKYKNNTAKVPSTFATAYPDISFQVVTSEQFQDFLY